MVEPKMGPQSMLRHLLFVDDEPRVLDSIRRSLRGVDETWTILFAGSVDEALSSLEAKPIDVIVTDITMPYRDGFDLLKAITGSPRFSQIPVLVLTGLADENLKRRALDAGAFDLIGKPVQRDDLIARLRSVLRNKDYQDSLAHLNATLEKQVADRTRDLDASRTDILVCLAMAGECRDSDTGRHLIRVAQYARLLAETMGLARSAIETIFKASPLHDIGKLGVPDGILLKPGPLDAHERALMQRHCEIGCRILTTPANVAAHFDNSAEGRPVNPLLQAAAEIALYHHERWDGTGYPRALKGEAIPLAARIVAVADVYDALTTERPYKAAMAHARAVDLQLKNLGSHFDPQVITMFERRSAEFDEIRSAWAETSGSPGNSDGVLGNLFTIQRKSA
jgi:putative two-component system response regulator